MKLACGCKLTSATSDSERDIEWTYSVPLSALAQPKRAGLVIYEGKYVFLNDREPAREYLKVNAEAILAAYGDQHRIKKEDASFNPTGKFESLADTRRLS